jgi:predicted NAD/FAD-dependent oxidoreductase
MPEHEKVKVAVVGAGVAGLAAARALNTAGFDVKVFDKGRRVGGRVSTRRDGDARFDHGAPGFTVRSPAFRSFVDGLISRNAVATWRPRTLRLAGTGEGETVRAEIQVGVPTMDALARELAAGLRIDCSTRVLDVETGTDLAPRSYLLRLLRFGEDRPSAAGPFAALVVTAPPAQAEPLVQSEPAASEALRSRRMRSQWVVMVEFESRPRVDFDAAAFGSPPLAWAGDESSKPGRDPGAARWMIHADPEWTSRHLEAEPAWVGRRLVEAFSAAVPGRLPAARRVIAHRWRYARSAPVSESVKSAWGSLLVAGDWCGGGDVEGAFLSGCLAAERLGTSMRAG